MPGAGTTSSTGPVAELVGIGPGAHAHVGGVRWWNVKHPAAYAARLAAGESPALAREVLDDETRRVERVLLEVRLRDGLPTSTLVEAGGRADVGRRRRLGGGNPGPARADPARAGCSPMPWCATCSDAARADRRPGVRAHVGIVDPACVRACGDADADV